MAGKQQVTLTLAGDSSKLTQAFDEVGTKADGMSTKVGDASAKLGDRSGFDTAAAGADNTYSKMDALESVGRGTTDTMSGLSEIMKGNVLQGATDLAGGAAALADGFSGALLPAIKGMITNSKIAGAASKAWAVAQGALNVVMSLNPILLVVLAVVALVAIFVIAYKKSETFRNIVKGAFAVVKNAASAVAEFFTKKLWPFIRGVFDKIVGAVRRVKDGIVAQFNGAVAFVRGLPGRISAGVRGMFNAVTGAVSSAKKWVVDRFNEVVGFVKGLPGKIKSAFSGLSSIITAPFKSAFQAIKRFWNSNVGGKGFTVPDWIPGLGGKSFRIPRFHTGGVMPGAPGSEGLALLQAGERVTRAGASSTTTIVIRDDGSDISRLLVKVLQKAIREQGGNVQAVLSRSA